MLNLTLLRIKQNIKIKRILAAEIIVIALAFLLSFAFQNYDDDYKKMQAIKVGLENNDMSAPASMLINNFKNTSHFSNLYSLEMGDWKNFKSDIETGKIDAGISIPEGFAEGLYHFENKPIKLMLKASTPLKNSILEETLSGYNYFVRAVDMGCYVSNDRIDEKFSSDKKREAERMKITVKLLNASLGRAKYFNLIENAQVPIVNSKSYYMVSLPLSFVAFLSLIGAIKNLKERNLGVQKRIRITGLSPLEIAGADYLAEIVFVILIFSPLLIYHAILMGIRLSLAFFISIILAQLFFSSLWKVLSFFISNKESLMICGVSISFLLTVSSGGIIPYLILPAGIKNFSKYIINFKLCKFSLGAGSITDILPFAILIFIFAFLDIRLNERRAN